MALIRIEEDNKNLWERISELPIELKTIIGSYSVFVAWEKIAIRVDYFKEWSNQNNERVFEFVAKKWTKQQVVWLVSMITGGKTTIGPKKKQIDILRSKLTIASKGVI